MKRIVLNKIHANSPNYKKFSALVDDDDYQKVAAHNWSVIKVRNVFYARARIDGTPIHLHNFILGYKHIDHINGNGLDNQKNNLRIATSTQNQINSRKRRNTSSKYKGVCWAEHAGKWLARLNFNYKRIHLGYYKTEINAAQAYNFAAAKHCDQFSRYNII